MSLISGLERLVDWNQNLGPVVSHQDTLVFPDD